MKISSEGLICRWQLRVMTGAGKSTSELKCVRACLRVRVQVHESISMRFALERFAEFEGHVTLPATNTKSRNMKR